MPISRKENTSLFSNILANHKRNSVLTKKRF